MNDVPFLFATVTHMVRALDYPFHERLLAVDLSPPRGRFSGQKRGDPEDVRRIADQLVSAGAIDRWELIPWDEESQRTTYGRWFGHSVEARATDGSAVYQYLWALDRCTGDYVLHADSDMLFFCPPGGPRWIDSAIEALRGREDLLAGTPRGGPPIWGEDHHPGDGWHLTKTFSTRCFLWDRRRVDTKLLPLIGGSGDMLERSVTNTMAARGLLRWCSNDTRTYGLHIWRRTPTFFRYQEDIIKAVEEGVYPFFRIGYPWDIRTDGVKFLPWLIAIKRSRITAGLRGLLGRRSQRRT